MLRDMSTHLKCLATIAFVALQVRGCFLGHCYAAHQSANSAMPRSLSQCCWGPTAQVVLAARQCSRVVGEASGAGPAVHEQRRHALRVAVRAPVQRVAGAHLIKITKYSQEADFFEINLSCTKFEFSDAIRDSAFSG